jgi:Bacterial regulatory protein, arsR family
MIRVVKRSHEGTSYRERNSGRASGRRSAFREMSAAARAQFASSVSEHLAILRAAGLVSTTRTGRYLVHQRTALGVALAR